MLNMKKLTLLSFFCFMAILAQGQSKMDKITLGVQTGLTFSWMKSNDNKINSNGVPLGFRIGLHAEYALNEKFSLCSGLHMAIAQGGHLKHDVGGNFFPNSKLSSPTLNNGDKPLPDGVDIKYKLQIFEVPFSLKMRTRDFGYISYFAELPIFTLGLVSKARGSFNGDNVKAENENINGDVVALNLGLGAGLGINYALTTETALYLGVYYHSIFTDMTEDDGFKAIEKVGGGYDQVSENSKGTMGQISIKVGVNF